MCSIIFLFFRYQSAMIICKLSNSSENTETVSVVEKSVLRANKTLTPTNYLNVTKNNNIKRNFTRCIPVLYDFHDKMALIQMLETDILFGMEHFIIYYNNDHNQSTVDDVLEFYQRKGVLELIKWDLPVKTKDIHYHGQIANMHDCLYRSMHRSTYVLFADVDEVVISPVFKSWGGLTNNCLKLNCAALQFQNAFFPVVFKSTNKNFSGMVDAVKYNMTFFLKTTHTKIHSHGDRSKLLVKPESIYFLFIHSVVKYYSKESQTCKVKHKDAMLHHYRKKLAIDMKTPYLENTIIHSLSSRLIPNIIKAMNSVQ
ncbi:hypothetical protein SNE40_014064 [Patella caerulea]|uniref:Glycosyltransferase family 92 protein n=1 Tax=Patella caerulea TaxID=87958 RepID=A0AAN8JHF1_PATCE